MSESVKRIKKMMAAFKVLNLGVVAVVMLFVVGKCFAPLSASAQDTPKAGAEVAAADAEAESGSVMNKPIDEPHAKVMAFAFLAAALATGIGSVGAGIAVSNVGAAAMGAVAEKPELMGKSLIYVALAEGIAIYGLLISIVILSKI